MPKPLVCLLVFVVAVNGACASAPKTRAFADLPKFIDPGSPIRLVETTGAMSAGKLGTLSTTSLTILSNGQSREVPEAQVATIRTPKRRPWQGALIGLGAGLAIGLAAAASLEPSDNPFADAIAPGVNVIAGVVLGTAAGAIVGALIRVDRTVYQATSREPQPAPR